MRMLDKKNLQNNIWIKNRPSRIKNLMNDTLCLKKNFMRADHIKEI